MLDKRKFSEIVGLLGEQAIADFDDMKSLRPPKTPDEFAEEIIYIICNAGMRNLAARTIFKRCRAAVRKGTPVSTVFSHPTKSKAIEKIWREREKLHAQYLQQRTDFDRLDYLESLPWIGKATKFHAAKSFGCQVAKPDRHIVRLAKLENSTPQLICERLAKETGHSVAEIDTILWRACSLNLLDSETGKLTGRTLPRDYRVHRPNRRSD